MLNILSLGAGVQSSTLALMAAEGAITPMPDCAIFADTKWEEPHTYKWLDELEKHLPFEVHRVSYGDLKQDTIDSIKNDKFVTLPFNQMTVEGIKIKKGQGRRQCSREYKVTPVTKKIRELMGLKPRQRAKPHQKALLWLGISTDEIIRMRPNREKYLENVFPLIDNGMSRQNCIDWLSSKGLGMPKKSSCIVCPYHADMDWRDMKINRPDSFKSAIYIDDLLRDGKPVDNQSFIHQSLKPLKDIDFRSLEDLGQTNLFGNECEGMCGV